jgi:hypothetical protein
MPNTDTTKTTNTTKNSSAKTSKYSNSHKSMNSTHHEQMDDTQQKSMRKAGRTILLKTVSGNSIDSTVFDSLTGLVSHSETKSSSSYFLTFDNVTNSLNAFNKLKSDSTDYKVKFSYYRVFFTINGLTDTSDYNQVKQDMTTFVTDKTKSSVLYCKFYRKDNKYLGCGDFTIDTMDGMNILLSKDGGIKDYTIGQLSGTFYRYNGKKDKSEQQADSNA